MSEAPNSLTAIAPADLMVDAGAGVTVAELAAAVAEHGLFWPPAVLVSGERTLGALLARAPGGNTRLGSTVRRYVLALDVKLADGSAVRAGARTVKCVTGYDLKQLFIGSRGCLGTIQGATLRLEAEANRAAVERRLEQDFAGLEAMSGGPRANATAAGASDGAGGRGGGFAAAQGWRDVLGRLKAELDPAGVLPSIDKLWPRDGLAPRDEAAPGDGPVSRDESVPPGEE